MRMYLPYPPTQLRPNFKCHWAVKHRVGKRHKFECGLLAKVRKNELRSILESGNDIFIEITFHPRTKHKIDRDNALAAMKWGLDGVAEAWGVNDHRFVPAIHVGNPHKGGKVVLEVVT